MTEEDKSSTLTTDLYEKYTSRMRFEHDLINNRITWLLVSQGLLFSAYSSSFESLKENTGLRSILPVLGILLSMLAAVGIVASMAAKFCTWQDLKHCKRYAGEPFWVRTWITWLAATAELLIPVAFAFAWNTLRP
jgi:hypothetical protein